MAAPSPTARTTPDGDMLRNGYQTLITFEAVADVDLWERTVTPPGFEGGDPIDTTTMFNAKYKTKAMQALIEMLQGGITCGYDPAALSATQIEALINVETTITVHFPDGSSWAFYGALRSATPNANANGTLPEMTVVFEVTNTDPSTGAEEDPVYTAPA